MKALILERNSLIRRRLERYFRCAGLRPVVCDNPDDLETRQKECQIFAADVFDGEFVFPLLEAHPEKRALFWTAEPLERALRSEDSKHLIHLLGRKDFESCPRGWELMMVLRRMLRPAEEGPKFAWYLDWGFTGFQERVDSSATRDRLVHKVETFLGELGTQKRVVTQFAEVTHELLMNAMYDAPRDAAGKPMYAADRKADLQLPNQQRPLLKLASDGSRLAVQVTDPFGSLTHEHVISSLARGLSGGQMDTSHGGAGLGLTLVHNHTAALFFDVVRGVRTEVTALFELDTNHRDFRLMPKSLHFFNR